MNVSADSARSTQHRQVVRVCKTFLWGDPRLLPGKWHWGERGGIEARIILSLWRRCKAEGEAEHLAHVKGSLVSLLEASWDRELYTPKRRWSAHCYGST